MTTTSSPSAGSCGTTTSPYVIIGGIAARLHDTGHATVDICPSRDETNLQNLTGALRALGARLRVEGDPSGVAFDPHPDMLRQVSTMTSSSDATGRSVSATVMTTACAWSAE